MSMYMRARARACIYIYIYHKLQTIDKCPTNNFGIMNEQMSKIASFSPSEVLSLSQWVFNCLVEIMLGRTGERGGQK